MMQKPEEEKENFFNELHAITSTIPRYDVLIIMGDINAKVLEKLEQITLVQREDRMAVK